MQIVSINVKNFRSVKNLSIENISEGLLLVGKNNAGKSAIINSLRAFFGQYSVQEEDFHKNTTDIEITIKFKLNDEYLKKFRNDSKLGLDKIPTNQREYNRLRENTDYSEVSFSQYKEIREGISNLPIDELMETHNDAIHIWISALKEKFRIGGEHWTVKFKINKSTLKYDYITEFETKVRNANLNELLTELGYSTEDVINTEVVIIVEGKDDKERLEFIFSKFYQIDTNKVLIIDAKSCHKIEVYATLRFLNKTTLSNEILIIRDSDTCDKDVIIESLLRKYRENLGEQYTEELRERIMVTNYSSLDCYFLNPNILVELELVRNEEQFYSKIERLLESERVKIEKYFSEKNSEERVRYIKDQLFNETDISQKLEDVKRYVRGHDLFGLFGKLKYKTQEYINLSSEEDFNEILTHLEKLTYFRDNKKQHQDV